MAEPLFSFTLDEPHLWNALVYVERNPVRARLTRVPWTYVWSSALAHTGGSEANGLLDMEYWAKEWSPAKWKKALRAGDDPEEAQRLRLHTSRGRPLASDRLLARLEHKLGRRLRPLPVGRPKRRKEI